MSRLGRARPQRQILTRQAVAPGIIAVTGLLGELNVEGFAATVDSGTIISVTGLLGEANVEGFAATITVLSGFIAAGLLGEVNVEGFAGTLTTENVLSFTSLLGEVHVIGLAGALTLEGRPDEEEISGAGSGRWDELGVQDGKDMTFIIKAFLEKVA